MNSKLRRMTKEHPGQILVTFLVLVVLARILFVKWTTTTIRGEYPVDSITIQSGSMSVKLSKQADFSEVIDMRILQGLTSREASSELERRFGEPKQIHPDGNSFRKEYWIKDLRIEYSRSLEYDEDGTIAGDCIHLSFFPANLERGKFLREPIAKHLRTGQSVSKITIAYPDVAPPYFVVYLDGTRIQNVVWLGR